MIYVFWGILYTKGANRDVYTHLCVIARCFLYHYQSPIFFFSTLMVYINDRLSL